MTHFPKTGAPTDGAQPRQSIINRPIQPVRINTFTDKCSVAMETRRNSGGTSVVVVPASRVMILQQLWALPRVQ